MGVLEAGYTEDLSKEGARNLILDSIKAAIRRGGIHNILVETGKIKQWISWDMLKKYLLGKFVSAIRNYRGEPFKRMGEFKIIDKGKLTKLAKHTLIYEI